MEKRTFLKTGLLFTIGAAVTPLLKACKTTDKAAAASLAPPTKTRSGAFELPALPYATKDLEPYIDTMTMEIHHGKHHNGYVTKLNKAIEGTKYANYELEDILARVSSSTSDKNVRNNGGGHWNHSLFWTIMAPGGSPATGALATAINSTFGSMDKFKEEFSAASKGVFGSGWAWLCVGADKKLFITSTPNQDNPLMQQIVSKTGTPILGIDVWEHAYYLKNQNRRADYIDSFFNVINWKQVGKNYDKAMSM
ncbi:MAG: superoxide dismutase [Saprospiraceae bacterium]